VKLDSAKPTLKVALPLYVVNHCTVFFKPNYCPLGNAITAGDVRAVLSERIGHLKKVIPPTLERVSVVEIGNDNATAVSDDSADVTEPDEDL
jgi:hypothetical protein